ncbi:transposase [Cytobacillus sp. Hz8]|uniref:transposase n=1 Tax=Cytobacillus sp. Hz8 TaxID=3347168 RepID=UPI0035D6AF56
MAKYSEQFKLMVVKEYQKGGLGYDLLAKKYGIKSSTPIQEWVKNMRNLVRKDYKARRIKKLILFNSN